MAIIRKKSSYNVVDAAYMRVKNIFSNNVPVYLSFSGGKDSLALAQVIYNLIQRGEINPKLLTVHFIDEEAIFPCVEQIVKDWRKKFMMVGATFHWYCIQINHFNCLNELEDSETFICWDEQKKDVWVRQPPKYAIRTHPLLKDRKETYQDFLPRLESDGISLIGVRTAESVQRLSNVALMKDIGSKKQLYPIYDWKDKDVWLFLKENNVKIPDIYLYLWQTGVSKGRLRVSQFFSIDTAPQLIKINEFYPDLMERIQKREPNAYLVALYWDSEMFRRSSTTRKKIEKNEKPRDYQKEVMELLSDLKKNFPKEHSRKIAEKYKQFVLKTAGIAQQKHYKRIHGALIAGDPKGRTLRALYTEVYSDARKDADK